jgi:hypothetical protein
MRGLRMFELKRTGTAHYREGLPRVESNSYNKIEAENVEPISNREAILQIRLQ